MKTPVDGPIANLSKMGSGLSRRVPTGKSPAILRRLIANILFIHSNPAKVERCVREIRKGHFQVEADVVLTPAQLAERLGSKSYEVVLAEYPSPHFQQTRALEILRQTNRHTALIYLVQFMTREIAADLNRAGTTYYIDMENLGHLPAVIRRILGENKLREQCELAEKRLKHSQARYRALAGNHTYGMCRWNPEGKLLDANQALVTMLGYASKKELMTEDMTGGILCDPSTRYKILEGSDPGHRVAPTEIDWKRKDGTTLKVQLNAREVQGDKGRIDGYEVIVEDVTRQREREDDLRNEATKDPLTGLANYRALVNVLDNELKRSARTSRQFALLLFDLDQLKKINDRYGHVIGSRALCRLADVLSLTCRDIDTAARFGGDEFALVLPETGAEPAQLVAKRICNTLAADGTEPKLTVSVGAAIYPQDGQKIESLLSAADVPLYAIKVTRGAAGKAKAAQADRKVI